MNKLFSILDKYDLSKDEKNKCADELIKRWEKMRCADGEKLQTDNRKLA